MTLSYLGAIEIAHHFENDFETTPKGASSVYPFLKKKQELKQLLTKQVTRLIRRFENRMPSTGISFTGTTLRTQDSIRTSYCICEKNAGTIEVRFLPACIPITVISGNSSHKLSISIKPCSRKKMTADRPANHGFTNRTRSMLGQIATMFMKFCLATTAEAKED